MLSLPALVFSLVAHAGDPCPIDVRLAEHTPSWRSRDADLAALATKRQWIGVSYRGRGGSVQLRAVGSNSPADRAGLRPGDTVVKVGEQTITTTQQLNAALDALTGSSTVQVQVQREGKPLTVSLGRGAADPVLMAMVDATASTDCREGVLLQLTEEQRAAVEAGAFDQGRGFRCETAHTALAAHFQSGDVVLVRGGRRILVTAPGWATRCVSVASLDGERLTPEAAKALLEGVVAGHVKDRHDNP